MYCTWASASEKKVGSDGGEGRDMAMAWPGVGGHAAQKRNAALKRRHGRPATGLVRAAAVVKEREWKLLGLHGRKKEEHRRPKMTPNNNIITRGGHRHVRNQGKSQQ